MTEIFPDQDEEKNYLKLQKCKITALKELFVDWLTKNHMDNQFP